MDKPRSKRPPDVNEALSSMLWTPYDQSAATSSSSNDSLSDDERHKGEKKLNRYSNPLPSSLNWWNNHQNVPSPHPLTLRYSFPYYGNFLAQPSPSCYTTNDNIHHSTATATAAKRTISTTVELGNHGQAINTSTFSTTMVHSFTDDFYQYQVIKKNLLSSHSVIRVPYIDRAHSKYSFRKGARVLLFTLAFYVFETEN